MAEIASAPPPPRRLRSGGSCFACARTSSSAEDGAGPVPSTRHGRRAVEAVRHVHARDVAAIGAAVRHAVARDRDRVVVGRCRRAPGLPDILQRDAKLRLARVGEHAWATDVCARPTLRSTSVSTSECSTFDNFAGSAPDAPSSRLITSTTARARCAPPRRNRRRRHPQSPRWPRQPAPAPERDRAFRAIPRVAPPCRRLPRRPPLWHLSPPSPPAPSLVASPYSRVCDHTLELRSSNSAPPRVQAYATRLRSGIRGVMKISSSRLSSCTRRRRNSQPSSGSRCSAGVRSETACARLT